MPALMNFLIGLTFIILISSYSFSGEKYYTCKTQDSYKLTRDGDLIKEDNHEHLFTINRVNGEIREGRFKNTHLENIFVISKGDKNNSFNMISFTKGNHWTIYVSINEFISGLKKPFTASDGYYILTGLCE